jgi:hypothetical protein
MVIWLRNPKIAQTTELMRPNIRMEPTRPTVRAIMSRGLRLIRHG